MDKIISYGLSLAGRNNLRGSQGGRIGGERDDAKTGLLWSVWGWWLGMRVEKLILAGHGMERNCCDTAELAVPGLS